MSTQQNQEINELCNLYMCNNSSESFQNNQNSISPPNSNDFDYNPCQFNFELQNEFQIRNGNVNHFSNDFGNGNNFNCGASENLCSQQFQHETSRVNNYKFDFVEQTNEIDDYLKFREKQNQIQMCDDSNKNPRLPTIDDLQLTTFEIDENLNKVVESPVLDLNLNSLENEDVNLQFDLPLSDSENLATLDCQHDKNDEVVNNCSSEDDFDERKLLKLIEIMLLGLKL